MSFPPDKGEEEFLKEVDYEKIVPVSDRSLSWRGPHRLWPRSQYSRHSYGHVRCGDSRGQSNCTEPSQRAHATPGNKLSGSLRGCLIAHRSLHGYGGGFRLSEARPHGHPARGG